MFNFSVIGSFVLALPSENSPSREMKNTRSLHDTYRLHLQAARSTPLLIKTASNNSNSRTFIKDF